MILEKLNESIKIKPGLSSLLCRAYTCGVFVIVEMFNYTHHVKIEFLRKKENLVKPQTYRLPVNSACPFLLKVNLESLYPHPFHFRSSCLCRKSEFQSFRYRLCFDSKFNKEKWGKNPLIKHKKHATINWNE